MVEYAAQGNKRLPKVLVQEKLVAYYESCGEAVLELDLTPDKDHLEAWRSEWDATFLDAGISSAADRLKTVGWLESKAASRSSSVLSRRFGLYESRSLGS